MPELVVTTDFLYRARLLTIKLQEQDYAATRLKSSLRKFYGYHNEFMDRYGISICTMETDLFNVSKFSFPLSSTLVLNFYEQLCRCFQKGRGRLHVRCIGPLYQFLVESKLLFYFCCFVRVILVQFMFFFCMCQYSMPVLCTFLFYFHQNLSFLDYSFSLKLCYLFVFVFLQKCLIYSLALK